MARIKPTGYTEDFRSLSKEALSMNETNDCTVKAIALACNVSYATAHAALKAAGRKERNGCYPHIQKKAIAALGYKVRSWTYMERRNFVKLYPGHHGKVLKHITTHHPRRFPQVWSRFNVPMMLFSHGHVSCFKDGVVHDWAINRAKRVTDIWEIIKA